MQQRKLWGVETWTAGGMEVPRLVGLMEHSIVDNRHFYIGEPARALLFTTRKPAREYCEAKYAQYAHYNDGICSKWRWRPVRVLETVRRI